MFHRPFDSDTTFVGPAACSSTSTRTGPSSPRTIRRPRTASRHRRTEPSSSPRPSRAPERSSSRREPGTSSRCRPAPPARADRPPEAPVGRRREPGISRSGRQAPEADLYSRRSVSPSSESLARSIGVPGPVMASTLSSRMKPYGSAESTSSCVLRSLIHGALGYRVAEGSGQPPTSEARQGAPCISHRSTLG